MGIIVKQIVATLGEPDYKDVNLDIRRVVAKDIVISYLLDFIYNHKEYRKLNFYGGTCAKVVYGLDRFSEDVDLDGSGGVEVSMLGDELREFVRNKMGIEGSDVYEQVGEGDIRRWVVRMPVMQEIGLSPLPSEKLHVKLEMSTMKKHATLERTPMVRHGRAMVISHFDLPSLMAGKMVACIERVWRKGREQGTEIKGRDFYDLIWYMQKNIKPNVEVLKYEGVESYTTERAWEVLSEKVRNIDKRELAIDLKSFIASGTYLDQWLDNFQDFYANLLKKT
jgi:predicted nucleotidyltransferase component of viral defense system